MTIETNKDEHKEKLKKNSDSLQGHNDRHVFATTGPFFFPFVSQIVTNQKHRKWVL